MQKISVLLAGTGGFAGLYVEELLHAGRAQQFQLVGAVDPYADQNPYGRQLMDMGIPVYDTVEEFYRAQRAELAFIVTPICLHAHQVEYCMEHGSDVLCEKPICASMQEAQAMMASRDRTGRKLGIGFQWSFSEGILKLKKDIMAGVYGKIRRIRTIVYFPRNLDYYHRGTGWAGKRRLETGEWLLDSVASNAAAHYLHNMLFLTGERMDRSAEVREIEAEVYRANPIEMFDTCALRLQTGKGEELLFYATHAVPYEEERGPEFIIEGEKGRVVMRSRGGEESMIGETEKGERIPYMNPGADNMKKLYTMGEAVRMGKEAPCTAETALPHLKCICALNEAFPETPKFPKEYIRYNEKKRQYTCEGLGAALDSCWLQGKLPGEMGAVWAGKSRKIRLL